MTHCFGWWITPDIPVLQLRLLIDTYFFCSITPIFEHCLLRFEHGIAFWTWYSCVLNMVHYAVCMPCGCKGILKRSKGSEHWCSSRYCVCYCVATPFSLSHFGHSTSHEKRPGKEAKHIIMCQKLQQKQWLILLAVSPECILFFFNLLHAY